MKPKLKPIIMLVVEDDPDDLKLTRKACAAKLPWPSLLLLDLNMLCKDCREVLRELRFQRIRVIVMTTGSSYVLNATSFITKPVKFESLVAVVKALGRYWMEIMELPDNGTPNAP